MDCKNAEEINKSQQIIKPNNSQFNIKITSRNYFRFHNINVDSLFSNLKSR